VAQNADTFSASIIDSQPNGNILIRCSERLVFSVRVVVD